MKWNRLAPAAALCIGALALNGCSTMLPGFASQRPACAQTEFSIYFAPGSNAFPNNARLILREGLKAIDQCRAQGGELVRATVRAYADADETGATAETAARERTETTVAALVEAGLAPERVVGVAPNRGGEAPLMRRRATVTLQMR